MAAECGLPGGAGMDEYGQGWMQVGKTIPDLSPGQRRVLIDGHHIKMQSRSQADRVIRAMRDPHFKSCALQRPLQFAQAPWGTVDT